MDNISIGKRIRSIRKSKGMTTDEFAKIFSKPASKGTISKWENGRYLPNNERLVEIANLGDISVDELLYGNQGEVVTETKSFINDKVTLIKVLKDEAYKITNELNKLESEKETDPDYYYSYSNQFGSALNDLEILIQGLNKPKYNLYIYFGVVYLMTEKLTLIPKDITFDVSFYKKIEVHQINENADSKILLSEQTSTKERLLEIIKKYHDYNTTIKLSYEAFYKVIYNEQILAN